MTHSILILGASVRAAAQSAVRAGWHPFAIDQFNDEDLLACCPSRRPDDFPGDILALANQAPRGPFLYTGGLENHPDMIESLAHDRPLLGNPARVVRAVRDPLTLHTKLSNRCLRFPEIRSADDTRAPGTWLRKPFRSGGGVGIRRVDETACESSKASRSANSHYLQRLVQGDPISAQYVAAKGTSKLLGVTRQLVGCAWAGADHYLYVGNVGPLIVPAGVTRTLQQVGDALAQDFQLVGLFGVDAILLGDEVWILEVNPRYTAAVEILERSWNLPFLQFHLLACEHHRLPDAVVPDRNCVLHGKAILYAPYPTVIPAEFCQWAATMNASSDWPIVADLPAAGTSIPRGGPICTVFATSPSETKVIDALRTRALQVFAVVERGRSGR